MNQEKPLIFNRRLDPYDVYVGRGSEWGNPFTVQQYGRGSAVQKFYAYLLEKIKADSAYLERLKYCLEGKRLGCYCAPKGGLTIDREPVLCHGQILARAARGDYEWILAELPTPKQMSLLI